MALKRRFERFVPDRRVHAAGDLNILGRLTIRIKNFPAQAKLKIFTGSSQPIVRLVDSQRDCHAGYKKKRGKNTGAIRH
jgi:hypothetical protein